MRYGIARERFLTLWMGRRSRRAGGTQDRGKELNLLEERRCNQEGVRLLIMWIGRRNRNERGSQ